jgi:hypothetical protein
MLGSTIWNALPVVLVFLRALVAYRPTVWQWRRHHSWTGSLLMNSSWWVTHCDLLKLFPDKQRFSFLPVFSSFSLLPCFHIPFSIKRYRRQLRNEALAGSGIPPRYHDPLYVGLTLSAMLAIDGVILHYPSRSITLHMVHERPALAVFLSFYLFLSST